MDPEEIHLEDDESPGSIGSYTSPRHMGAAGHYRYLKPKELSENPLAYDFAVIVNRAVKMDKFTSRCGCSSCFSCFSDETKYRNTGFRRLCLVNSPLLQECEDEHRRIVDRLCSQGLIVDIIDGGHSEGEMTSDFFILLIHASEQVISAYAKRFRQRLWMKHGSVGDFEVDFTDESTPTPAERIQIVHYIIEQKANISCEDCWIHDMFPVHDVRVTNSLISQWFTYRSTAAPAAQINSIRYNFGEKVAYYFAFIHFYNRGLLPIALLGTCMYLIQKIHDVTTYMRLLPFWGITVSVIWSFLFLKSWDRQCATLQYDWNHKLDVRQIEYPNKHFKGVEKMDPETGETYLYYPSWKRIPKYLCVGLFMLLQTVVMIMLVALWISIYEVIKVHYPDGRIFGTQWFLILLEGMVFGFFVDVVQWNILVTRFGRLFTHWENYRTEEAFERALIRKLFIMDFLNYYTWFFSLAFIYVIPGVGDYITHGLNHVFFNDKMNCCFGTNIDQFGNCIYCPPGETCIECTGWMTFDRNHVNLSAMFVTPIIVTQLLNIIIAVVMPLVKKARHERARAHADAMAQKRVMAAGSMRILGALDYDDSTTSHLGNKSNARYLEYTASEIEILNKKAREVLFESSQDHYDPYNDFHVLTVQFGFTVMFSILWPLMPLACMGINFIKIRADGYRLCRTLKRPFPRKASGIGDWRTIFWSFAFIAVVVNIALICISTGTIEFFIDDCIKDITHKLEKQGKTLDDFVLGPDFGCLHFTTRLLIIMGLEHLFLAIALLIFYRVPGVPKVVERLALAREVKFKVMLQENAALLPMKKATPVTVQAYQVVVEEETHPLSPREIASLELVRPNTANSKEVLARKWSSSD